MYKACVKLGELESSIRVPEVHYCVANIECFSNLSLSSSVQQNIASGNEEQV